MFFPSRPPSFQMAPPAPVWERGAVTKTLAVDLDTIKNFLNIPLEDDFFDDEKTAMALAAQRAIETYCQMSLPETTWVCKLPMFYDELKLMKRPFIAVTKVEYADPDTGTITELASDQYGWGVGQQKVGFLYRGEDVAWPDTARRWDAVRITCTAGFPDASLADYEDIAQAILITIASLDKSRADDGATDRSTNTVYGLKNQTAPTIIPPEAKALLAPHIYRSLCIA